MTCRKGKMRPHVRKGAAVLSLLATFVLGACEGTSALERARDRGFIRAGYVEEPPYALRDSAGRVTGESPEALRAAAARLGIPGIQWVRLDFDDLIPALGLGRVDVVAAGLFRTPERAERVRFSRPTVCAGSALIVRGDEAASVTLASWREEGGRLAVLSGSVEEAALRSFAPDRILGVPDLATGLVAVRGGNADALAVTAPTARRAVSREGDGALDVVGYEPPPDLEGRVTGCSALAFRPEDEALARAVDRTLADVLTSDGHLGTLRSLGFTRSEILAAVDSAGSSSR